MQDTTISTTEPQPRRTRIPLAAAARVRSSLAGIVRALATAGIRPALTAAILLCALLLAGCSKESAGEDQCGRPPSYPYVLDGKYIVAADANGDYGGRSTRIGLRPISPPITRTTPPMPRPESSR